MDEQDLLAETLESLFADHCSAEVVGACEGSWAGPLWKTIQEAGLTLVGIPEEAGGSGGGISDLATVLRTAGRHAAPLPLAETNLLGGWALATSGLKVPAGPLSLVLGGPGEELAFAGAPGAWRLEGTAPRVPWAGVASRLVVVAPGESGLLVAAVDPALGVIRPGRTVAGDPSDEVSFRAATLEASDVMKAGEGVTVEALFARGALSRALLMAGALERVCDLTVSYASERHQFGRPISRFQAVQQQLAVLAGEVAATRAAVGHAVEALAEEDSEAAGRGRETMRMATARMATAEIAAAKIRAGEAAAVASAIAHQVHL
ncbi:MAG: acyl-CoA dehydrogenase family protein, partial [Acidimicrobiia bacterium]